MTELEGALAELAERGDAAGPVVVTARAIDVATARGRRSRWPAVVVASAAAVAVTLAAGVLYVRDKTADVDRVNLAGVLAAPAEPGDGMNILVVGVDGDRNAAMGVRGDSIALVRVSANRGVVAVLSIPRDLYVDGASDSGAPDRINVAASDTRRLVALVQRETGLAVDHYAELNGTGFGRLIDAFGGVTLRVAAPVRDRLTGLDLPAGCVRLDGESALAWDRSRHLESFEGGRWVVDPTGDLGRIQRQQQLALAALRQLAVARDPRLLARLLDIAADNLRVDAGFPFATLRKWVDAAATGQGDATLLTLPTTVSALDNGAAVLRLDDAQVPGVVAAFETDAGSRPIGAAPTCP